MLPASSYANVAGGPTPVLRMPEAEAEAVRDAYESATTILEYGSGGSTELAAQMAGKTIFSVENDKRWFAKMQAKFDVTAPAARVVLHLAETGETGKWGFPKDNRRFRIWPLYATSVWDRDDFRHPDVVLIDGRFRAACFLTTLFRITRPVTVLWDDYQDRTAYHDIETFCPPMGRVGRMAIFNAEPTPIPADKLGFILSTYLRPE